MATGPMTNAIQRLRSSALARDGAHLSDSQLVERFARHRDEAAFETLVRRHGPMVWGVCRRMLRGHHDAEDAFQATFLVLARKAAAIVRRELLANWLYGVARQTAVKARALAARRRTREKQMATMPESTIALEEQSDELERVLDEELGLLAEKYRAPLVLCDLQGKTRAEAARQLGWPEGTVAGRLARGRAMLARRLTRRGVTLSSAALAAVLARSAAASVPVPLLSATSPANIVSTRALALAEGVMKAMLITRLKTISMLLFVLSLLAGAGGLLSAQALSQEPAVVENTHVAGLPTIGKAPLAQAQPGAKPQANAPKVDPRLEETKKLQGTWIVVGDDDPPPVLPEKQLKGAKWIFENGQLIFGSDLKMPEKIYRYFLLDPTKNPKTISVSCWATPAGNSAPLYIMDGVYELDGDRLKIHFAPPFGPKPIAFPAKPLPGQVTILQRERQPKPGLSARIEVKTKFAVEKVPIEADLVLTNETDQPLRLCTLVGGFHAGSADASWVEFNYGPDQWKSDSPPPEMSAKHLVALQPGKSVAIPCGIGSVDKTTGTLTIRAAYATGNKFATKHNTWSGKVEAKPVALPVARVSWYDMPKDLKASDRKVEFALETRITPSKGVLDLPVTIKNQSAQTITSRLTYEWHGGKHPTTDLYASVTPAKAKEDEPFVPVFLVKDQGFKFPNPVTLAAGKPAQAHLRMDWPGTGSVPALPLMQAPGTYRVRLLLVFEADGVKQYVVSPEFAVEMTVQ